MQHLMYLKCGILVHDGAFHADAGRLFLCFGNAGFLLQPQLVGEQVLGNGAQPGELGGIPGIFLPGGDCPEKCFLRDFL